MNKRLFIIKVGTTFSEITQEYGDFDDWALNGLGCNNGIRQNKYGILHFSSK
jgi:hypothetical protein